MKKTRSLLAVLACSLAVFGCAETAQKVDKNAETSFADVDSLEAINRPIFEFNRVFDMTVLKPIAQGYGEIMPARGRVMVSNFVGNVKEPVTFLNSVVQADPYNSFASLWRFLLNSTVGIGGLFDVATEIGLEDRETGFGDTLAIYGFASGPYFVIPIIGPSTTRDSFGRLGDLVSDPFSYTPDTVIYSIVGVKTIDTRYHKLKLLDDVYADSLDPYSTIRSGYLQYRASAVEKAKKARKKSQEKAIQEAPQSISK